MVRQKVTDEEIIKCMNDGMTQAAIAEKYGVHFTTINKRIKKILEQSQDNAGSNPPAPENNDPETFDIMDTVVHRKNKQWFRIIGHEDVFYELRPLGKNKHAGDTNDIEVHIKDLKKNYYKKDYPKVTCYNLADQEEKEKEEPEMGDYNSTGKIATAVRAGLSTNSNMPTTVPLEPAENVRASNKSLELMEEETRYFVKRKYLQRIDRILDAVEVAEATDDELAETKALIGHIIVRGIQEEIDA